MSTEGPASDRARYPKDWPAISRRIRGEEQLHPAIDQTSHQEHQP